MAVNLYVCHQMTHVVCSCPDHMKYQWGGCQWLSWHARPHQICWSGNPSILHPGIKNQNNLMHNTSTEMSEIWATWSGYLFMLFQPLPYFLLFLLLFFPPAPCWFYLLLPLRSFHRSLFTIACGTVVKSTVNYIRLFLIWWKSHTSFVFEWY